MIISLLPGIRWQINFVQSELPKQEQVKRVQERRNDQDEYQLAKDRETSE